MDDEVTDAPTTIAAPADSVPAEELERPPTPGVDVGAARMAVPAAAGVGLFAALAALEITKRPRRSLGDEFDPDGDNDEGE